MLCDICGNNHLDVVYHEDELFLVFKCHKCLDIIFMLKQHKTTLSENEKQKVFLVLDSTFGLKNISALNLFSCESCKDHFSMSVSLRKSEVI